MIRSCEEWGIEARIEGRKSQGSWELNCAQKPAFILEKLEQLKKPVLWVDADALFLDRPNWSEFQECDVAVRINARLSEEVLSGTVFINYTEEGLAVVRAWVKECQELVSMSGYLTTLFGLKCNFWDQSALKEVLLRTTNTKILPLPVPYCKIFDLDQDAPAIIEHRQASRRFKDQIKNY